MKDININLTESQAIQVVRLLEYNNIDNTDGLDIAYTNRIVRKIKLALLPSVDHSESENRINEMLKKG